MHCKDRDIPAVVNDEGREKLALYIYEYLVHAGAPKSAQAFLSEIRWEKNISLGDPPGFLHSWWSVFWDLYCAAPERRDCHVSTIEAKAFHDYGFVNPSFSSSGSINHGTLGPVPSLFNQNQAAKTSTPAHQRFPFPLHPHSSMTWNQHYMAPYFQRNPMMRRPRMSSEYSLPPNQALMTNNNDMNRASTSGLCSRAPVPPPNAGIDHVSKHYSANYRGPPPYSAINSNLNQGQTGMDTMGEPPGQPYFQSPGSSFTYTTPTGSSFTYTSPSGSSFTYSSPSCSSTTYSSPSCSSITHSSPSTSRAYSRNSQHLRPPGQINSQGPQDLPGSQEDSNYKEMKTGKDSKLDITMNSVYESSSGRQINNTVEDECLKNMKSSPASETDSPREDSSSLSEFNLADYRRYLDNDHTETVAIMKIKESMQEEAKRFEKDSDSVSYVILP